MIPRWLKIYLLGIALAILTFAVVGVARADVGISADQAERMMNARQVTDTLPPPPRPASDGCNSATYYAYDNRPVLSCYRAVAAERDWSLQKIAAWEPFLVTEFSGAIQGESSMCWNLRGGDTINAGTPCIQKHSAPYPGDDTGFGQVTRSYWGSSGKLCTNYGVCSAAQILASPYTSMLYSVIIPVELDGSQGWCFAGWAISYHQCWEAPDR